MDNDLKKLVDDCTLTNKKIKEGLETINDDIMNDRVTSRGTYNRLKALSDEQNAKWEAIKDLKVQ